MFLVGEKGNNIFSYEQRKKHGSGMKLYVPPLIEGTVDDVKVTSQITFEEFDEQNQQIASFSGLEKGVTREHAGKKIFVVDNHNHAFYCRRRAQKELGTNEMNLVHIDQHSDLAEPASMPDLSKMDTEEYVAEYTNEVLQVGNFIKPAQLAKLVADQHQIRTELGLLEYEIPPTSSSVILDIDLDFRAPEMPIDNHAATIKKTKELLAHPKVKIVTIATSPFFIEQRRAIELLRELLE